jgi:hypothetical protein
MLADQIDPPRRMGIPRWRFAMDGAKGGGGAGDGIDQVWTSGTARSIAAAASGVRSRCASASNS